MDMKAKEHALMEYKSNWSRHIRRRHPPKDRMAALLKYVDDSDGVTAKDAAKEVGMLTSAAGSLLGRLYNKRLVRRVNTGKSYVYYRLTRD